MENEISVNGGNLPSQSKLWLRKYPTGILNNELPKETIYSYFVNSTKRFSNLTALNYFGLKVSYDELKRKIDECAKAFVAMGVKKGEIVTIVMPTMPEAIYVMYALNKIGAVSNFIHPLSSTENFKYLINEVNTRILVTFDKCLGKINPIIGETNIEKIVTVSPFNSMPVLTKMGLNVLSTIKGGDKIDYNNKMFTEWSMFIRNGRSIDSIKENLYEPNTTAVITHTSGSTGVPKGAELTDDNFNIMVHQYRLLANNFRVGDTMLTVMPPFASFGLCNCMHMPLCLGVSVVLVPKYDPKDSYKYYNKYHFNHWMGIPAYFVEMAKDPRYKNVDLFSMGYLCCGGAKIDEADERMVNNFLKEHGANVKITKGYGMTEVTSSGAYTFENSNEVGSVGTVLPFTNLKIVNIDTNQELGFNEEGEICFSGLTIMKSYYNNEEANNKTFSIDDNGVKWVKTGDLGYITSEGILYVTGRIKRVILTMGADKSLNKVNPDKIEEVIKSHNDVENCVVIGIKHDIRLAVPKVFITLKPGVNNTNIINEIDSICQEKLRETLLPYEYVIITNIPKTPIGKIDFKKLENDPENVKVFKKVRN